MNIHDLIHVSPASRVRPASRSETLRNGKTAQPGPLALPGLTGTIGQPIQGHRPT